MLTKKDEGFGLFYKGENKYEIKIVNSNHNPNHSNRKRHGLDLNHTMIKLGLFSVNAEPNKKPIKCIFGWMGRTTLIRNDNDSTSQTLKAVDWSELERNFLSNLSRWLSGFKASKA